MNIINNIILNARNPIFIGNWDRICNLSKREFIEDKNVKYLRRNKEKSSFFLKFSFWCNEKYISTSGKDTVPYLKK